MLKPLEIPVFSRKFAMPSSRTFSILPIKKLLQRYIGSDMTVVDPFAGDSRWGTHTNDLNPDSSAQRHLYATDYAKELVAQGLVADAVLFDPPYSPRQISEVYKGIGLKVGMRETQNGRMYREVKDELHKLLRPGGLAICFGWNSMGFGKTRGYEMNEILLVPHGGPHNDTIVTVEIKLNDLQTP